MADIATNKFVDETIAETRGKINELLESVHAGKFRNDTGRADGEELENKINSLVKAMSDKIAKDVNSKLPKDNRIVQMVESGSKGSGLNVQQMVALLGQQLIEGRRIQ